MRLALGLVLLLFSACGGGAEPTPDAVDAWQTKGFEAAPAPPYRASSTRGLVLEGTLGARRWLHVGGWEVVFHPTRPLLLSRGREPQRLWDLERGTVAGTLPEQDATTTCAAWSSDGAWLAVGTLDGVRILDGGTYEERARLGGFREVQFANGVNSLAISPDDRHLVACGSYDEIRGWETTGWTREFAFTAHDQGIPTVAFAPDGTWFATVGGDYHLRTWTTGTGEARWCSARHGSYVEDVAIAPDGRRIATASMDETVRVWDAASGEEEGRLECSDNVNAVAFSPDGRLLAAGEDGGLVRCWDAESLEVRWTGRAHEGDVYCVRFAPDGRALASLGKDGAIRLWDPAEGEVANRGDRHGACINCLALTPDGRTLVSGSDDRTLRLWDVESGRLRRVLEGHDAEVESVAVSPDGRWLISGAETFDTSHNFLRWRLDREAPPEPVAEHEILVYAVALTPDGRRVLSTGGRWIRIWDAATGAPLHTLTGHGSFTTALAVDPRGRWAASGNHDATVRIWDLGSGACRQVLEPESARVTALAVSPDGKRLASGGDGRVHVWDPATGALERAWTTGDGRTDGLCFGDDGSLLLVVGSGHLNILDPDDGALVDRIAVQGDPETVVMRGDRVWVGCADGTIAVYRLDVSRNSAAN